MFLRRYRILDGTTHSTAWAPLITDMEEAFPRLQLVLDIDRAHCRIVGWQISGFQLYYVNHRKDIYPFEVWIRIEDPARELWWAMNCPDLPGNRLTPARWHRRFAGLAPT